MSELASVARAVLGFLATAALVAVGLTVFSAGADVSVPAEAMVIALGGLTLGRLLLLAQRLAPPPDDDRLPLVRLRREKTVPPDGPAPLRELEGVVAGALMSGRSAHHRLYPRLAGLVTDPDRLDASTRQLLFTDRTVRVESGTPGVDPAVLDRAITGIEEATR